MFTVAIGVIYAGIFGIYVGNIIAGILVAFATLIYLRSNLGLPLFNRKIPLIKELRNNPLILTTSLMLYCSAITAALSYLAARYSILANFGEIQAGLLHSVMVLSFAFGTFLYPAINIYLNPLVNRNVEQSVKAYQVIQFQRKIVLVMGLAALPILMFPKFILTMMFSETFATVGEFAYLFVLSQFVVQLAGIYQSLLIGFNDVKSYTLITCTTQIISAALCFYLAPQFGIKGIAFGFLIGNVLNLAACLIKLTFKYDFSLPLNITSLTAFIFVILFLTGEISNWFIEWNVNVILVKILFSLFFCVILYSFLNPEEKAYLKIMSSKILTFGKLI